VAFDSEHRLGGPDGRADADSLYERSGHGGKWK
jgi:hypothetical protein